MRIIKTRIHITIFASLNKPIPINLRSSFHKPSVFLPEQKPFLPVDHHGIPYPAAADLRRCRAYLVENPHNFINPYVTHVIVFGRSSPFSEKSAFTFTYTFCAIAIPPISRQRQHSARHRQFNFFVRFRQFVKPHCCRTPDRVLSEPAADFIHCPVNRFHLTQTFPVTENR